MIIVDLNNEKEITYHVPIIKNVKNVDLVVTLPNYVEIRYHGTLNLKKEEITIIIPILKDIIKDKLETECYLEFEDFDKRFYRNKPETILFQYSPVIKLKFHELPKQEINATNKEDVDEKNTVVKNVGYKKSDRPPRRLEVTSINI